MIDLRDGDLVEHANKRFRILTVRAYPDAVTDTLKPAAGDGYAYERHAGLPR